MRDKALMVNVLGFLLLRSWVAVQLLFLFADHLSDRIAVLLVLLKSNKGSAIVHTGIEMLYDLSVKVVDPVHWQLEVGEVIQVAFRFHVFVIIIFLGLEMVWPEINALNVSVRDVLLL